MSDFYEDDEPIDDVIAAFGTEPHELTRAPKSEKRQRSAVISVRVTPEELAIIEAAAHRRGLLISTYLREQALSINYVSDDGMCSVSGRFSTAPTYCGRPMLVA